MNWLHPVQPIRIRTVGSLQELVTTPFKDGINALCWQRTLPGDFHEIVEALPAGEGIVPTDEDQLASLTLSDAGKAARGILLADLESLRAYDLQPELDCVHGSERQEPDGLFHTDVHSWHVDTATVPADTYLCTYVGARSEGLPKGQAQRRVDMPETRAELLRLYGGEDDAGFLGYKAENFYDLHYAPLPGAQPFSFGLGNLWRIAIQYLGCPLGPRIHRAPLTLSEMPARLLLITSEGRHSLVSRPSSWFALLPPPSSTHRRRERMFPFEHGRVDSPARMEIWRRKSPRRSDCANG